MDEVLHKSIILELTDDDKLQYVAVDRTEVKPVICMRAMEFPYRKIDSAMIIDVKNSLLDNVTQKKLLISKKKLMVERKVNLMSVLTTRNGTALEFQQTVNLQQSIKFSLDIGLKNLQKEIVEGFGTLKMEADLTRLVVKQNTLLATVDNLLLELLSLLEDPLSLLSIKLQKNLEKISDPTIIFYRLESDEHNIELGEVIVVGIAQGFLEVLQMPLNTPEIVKSFLGFEKYFHVSIVDVFLFTMDLFMLSGFCCACATNWYNKHPAFLKPRKNSSSSINRYQNRTPRINQIRETFIGPGGIPYPTRRTKRPPPHKQSRYRIRTRGLQSTFRKTASEKFVDKQNSLPMRERNLPVHMMDSDLSSD
jgi:hypothetical protein